MISSFKFNTGFANDGSCFVTIYMNRKKGLYRLEREYNQCCLAESNHIFELGKYSRNFIRNKTGLWSWEK